MSIIQGNAHTSAGGGYQIERSLRFNSADSAYLNRTPASASNRKTFTWSGWVKRGSLSSTQALFESGNGTGIYTLFWFTSSDQIQLLQDNGSGGVLTVTTNAVFRDPSAWYHIVIAFDTTQATSNNRTIIYVNGINQSLTYAAQLAQNADTWVNFTYQHRLGVRTGGTSYYNGYMTEVNFIDGQALTPSDFGETDSATGVWKPKAYSGTYGTNGFYLKFADNSGATSTTLGKDSSGNGNNWTPNNFSVTAGAGNDSLVDSPTSYGTDTGVGGEVRGNYCTLNPLINPSADTFSNGNLQVVTSSSNYGTSVSSIAIPTTGKWYAECTIVATASYPAVGICSTSSVFTATSWVGSFTGVTYYGKTGNKFVNATGSSYGATYGANDVIGIAYDADNLQITFYKNNTTQGTITGVTAGTYYFGGSEWDPASGTQVWNFGQRAFAYTAPSGFKALCTQNLPTPTIGATSTTQANDYMNVVLYTGNGSTQSITGVGFQPDFSWLKARSSAISHGLFDAVRGAGKALFSNATNAEFNYGTTTSGELYQFTSDGFNLGSFGNFNANGVTNVAWNWKAGGTGVTNTAGTITSTVSANTTAGFSIVTYTGTAANATVGHGLGVAPSMIITKRRTTFTSSWGVWHTGIAATEYLLLNSTAAKATATNAWNSTAPSSTVVSLGDASFCNGSVDGYVMYCFAPVAGYSAFGSYTGNGSADGPFVYTGFKPKFVMVKQTNTSGNSWWMFDGVRSPTNAVYNRLAADLSDAEYSNSSTFDFLSNGFKLRFSDTAWNGSGSTYIYAAFAETPAKFSLAR